MNNIATAWSWSSVLIKVYSQLEVGITDNKAAISYITIILKVETFLVRITVDPCFLLSQLLHFEIWGRLKMMYST